MARTITADDSRDREGRGRVNRKISKAKPAVELMLVENLVQARVERVRGTARQLLANGGDGSLADELVAG